jgi:hypothetical protein
MPENRAERRRQKGGASSPPPRRDPMLPIYIGAGVLVVLVIAGFALYNWNQTRIIQQAYATPTPGPNASTKPIQLADGGSIGTPHFKEDNTPAGGHGQPVDGITCLGMEGSGLHVHTHLSLYDNGKQIQIPKLIGFTANPNMPGGGCLYWIHTHDASGIIHVEAPEVQSPQGGPYTLGMLFDIWGEPLSTTGIAGFDGPVTAYVNGAAYTGDLRNIPLLSHQQIVLEVGQPVVPPPNYAFPAND